jgi:hypothetical protein
MQQVVDHIESDTKDRITRVTRKPLKHNARALAFDFAHDPSGSWPRRLMKARNPRFP